MPLFLSVAASEGRRKSGPPCNIRWPAKNAWVLFVCRSEPNTVPRFAAANRDGGSNWMAAEELEPLKQTFCDPNSTLEDVARRRGRKAWPEDVVERRGQKAWPEGVARRRARNRRRLRVEHPGQGCGGSRAALRRVEHPGQGGGGTRAALRRVGFSPNNWTAAAYGGAKWLSADSGAAGVSQVMLGARRVPDAFWPVRRPDATDTV